MRIRIRVPQVLVLVGVIALGAVGLAAIAQYQFDMQPCPWCVLQRLIYIVVGVLALLGALLSGLPRRLAVGLAFVVAVSGIGTALYQQLHAVNEASCGSPGAAAVHRLRLVRRRRGVGAARPVRRVELRAVRDPRVAAGVDASRLDEDSLKP